MNIHNFQRFLEELRNIATYKSASGRTTKNHILKVVINLTMLT